MENFRDKTESLQNVGKFGKGAFVKNSTDKENRSGYIFLFIFIIIAAGILTGGYFAYRHYEKDYRAEVEHQLSAIAELKVGEIVQWRKERLGDGDFFFRNDIFSALVKRYFENQNDRDTKKEIQTWLMQLQKYDEYDMVMLLDTQLTKMIIFPESEERKHSFAEKNVVEMLQTGNTAFQDFYFNEQNQRIYLKVLIPIHDEYIKNRVIGILALRIDPEKYLYPLMRTWPTPSKTAETLIIRRDGNDALFLNDLKFRKDAALNLRIPLESKNVLAVKAALGIEGIVEGIDYRGVQVIGDVRAVPDSPWFIVVRMDLAEVYAPLKERFWLMIILVSALLVSAGAGIGLVWRQQRNRFYQKQNKSMIDLRDSEFRYRRLFEAARDGILILDAETGMIVDVNPFLVQMLGYSREQFLGKRIWELGFFKDIAASKLNFTELQQKEFIQYENLPLETIEGQLIDVEFVSHIYQVDHHKVMQCNIRNITERKRAEEELRETTDYLESLLSFANAPIMVWDNNNRITRFNLAFERLTGYTMYDVLGKHPEMLFSDDKREEISVLISRTSDGENLISVEILVRCKDGSVRAVIWNTANIYSTDEKTIIATIALGQDITERKQAEEGLKKSEEKYRSIFENVQDVYYETSFDSTVLEVSPSIEFISKGQYHRTDLIGKSMYEFYPDTKDRDTIIAAMQKTSSVTDFEVRLKNRDGSFIPCSISAKMIFDAEGRPNKIIGSMHDISERKRAEAELATIQQRYQELFDNVDIGILRSTAGPEGAFIDVNPAMVKMFEADNREQLMALHPSEIYLDPSQRRNVSDVLMSKGFIKGDEVRLKTLKGRPIWCRITAVKKTNANGQVYFDNTVEDISERKQAEEKLQESETRYRSVLQSATDAIVTADSSGIIIGWNSGAERIFGYSYTEAVGQPLTSIMPLYHHAGHTNRIKRLQSEGDQDVIGKTVELEGLRKDKSVFPLELSLSTWEIKSEQFITGIIRDVTERKRAQEALQDSELRFRSLYENATIGLYRTTPDGKILLANPALVKMLGYTSFQKLAERNLEKDGFESSSHRKEFLEKIERDGEVTGYESKWIRQDGRVIFVLESARSIRDSQGKTMYYDGTLENITERKLLEDQMRQMQKLEGLGTLAGGIAHDFNNILGIILAFVTSIKRFKDDTKKLDLAVDTIVKAVERGKTLVQQILMFARKTETVFGAVNVNDIVMEIMTMIMETFPKTLTYAQNFDKSIAFINADRSQLYQVLLNLCVNARDAMPKGGVLTIITRMVSVVSLRNQHPDAAASGYVCIEVSDTGEGMSEEIERRIFEPFFTTKGIGKGTGLGLSVVFGIVQAHKGYIDVESELGKGTTFRLYLPASQVAAPISVKDEQTVEEIPGGTETLLVVEDEEMLLMSLQMVLIEKGYKVISAGDGFTALKIYQEKKDEISLVLTDLGLPNISGLEVCRKIKKINPKERMIVATGFLDPEMKSEFLKARIQHFLYKPYDLKQVLKVIREVIDEK